MNKKLKIKKKFALDWLFEPLEENPSFFSKRMFGGLAAYFEGKMVFVLVEDAGERVWKGKKFDFDIWNGVLIPTERDFHDSLLKDFNGLIQHPVLGKWLYLPMSTPDFEETAQFLVVEVQKRGPRIGIIPKSKK